jgi:hypothetical protein
MHRAGLKSATTMISSNRFIYSNGCVSGGGSGCCSSDSDSVSVIRVNLLQKLGKVVPML